ncbi:protein phosphatase 1 regulatory subunit 36 isoform X2 [Protopterus annectens]|nr:protein phosphatase 1 regulatory subunit 36 isoform X2 [Protopterus annectens]
MSLLSYLSCYLEKIALGNKPKSLMTEPGLKERRSMAEASARVELTKNNLAQMYLIVLLGLGMEHHHHMTCGKSRVSATRKDRILFECLYNFSVHVAWITFRRQNLNVIEEEVGRLFRSDTFNPALRVKKNTTDGSTKNTTRNDKNKMPHTEHRKQYTKRPAIKSIVNQRSPVLISLLPSPKEKAKYLFHPHKVQMDKTSKTYDEEDIIEELPTIFSAKVGIIGELRKNFDPHTLNSLGLENENEEHEKEEDISGKKSGSNFCSQSMASPFPRDTRSRLSYRNTAISRATTEGAYSDTD